MPCPLERCINMAGTHCDAPITGSKWENKGTLPSDVRILCPFCGNMVVERNFPRLLRLRCVHVTKVDEGICVDVMRATSVIIFMPNKRPLP